MKNLKARINFQTSSIVHAEQPLKDWRTGYFAASTAAPAGPRFSSLHSSLHGPQGVPAARLRLEFDSLYQREDKTVCQAGGAKWLGDL